MAVTPEQLDIIRNVKELSETRGQKAGDLTGLLESILRQLDPANPLPVEYTWAEVVALYTPLYDAAKAEIDAARGVLP